MIRLTAAHLFRTMRFPLLHLRASFAVSSFAYLLRVASVLAPTPEPQPALAG